MREHEMEMDDVRQEFEQIAELNNRIERVRSDLIWKQDMYNGNVGSKAPYEAAIARTHEQRQYSERITFWRENF